MKLAAALLALTAIATPAHAARITYSLDGRFDGTAGGMAFRDVAATITGIADTDDATAETPALTSIRLDSLGADTGPTTITFGGLMQFRIDRVAGTATVRFDGSTEPLLFGSAALIGYDGTTRVDPTAVDYRGGGGTVPSSEGAIAVSAARGLVFTSDPGITASFRAQAARYGLAIAAVPEPASWGLMVLGFGAIGIAGRKRRPAPAII